MNIEICGGIFQGHVKHTQMDWKWDNRESKTVTLEMDVATVAELFKDDVAWGVNHEDGTVEDLSDYCVAGPVVDHRDGTVTVKMGKPTAEELLAVIMGGK